MIQNYIRIDGEYVKQEDIPPEQMLEISVALAVRFAEGFGYVPVNSQKQGSLTTTSGHSSKE